MFKKSIALGMMLVMVFVLTGCLRYNPYTNKANPVVVSECGHLYIQLRKESGYALVLELTELGKEQEVVAIPDYVEGLPVKEIGLMESWYGRYWGIKSDNLKKIYIPYTVENTLDVMVELWEGFEEIISVTCAMFDYTYLQIAEKTIVIEEEIGKWFNIENLFPKVQSPNLICYFNYKGSPNSNYFWIDLITGDNLYLNPSSPTREGYVFTGWYLEEECTTKWNEVLPASEDEELKLYAGWNEA